MYTINNFCYGHQIAEDKKLNNSLNLHDVEFRTVINDKTYEVSIPYHGGVISNDIHPIIFGCCITHDDCNPDYISEVRNNREEDYYEGYQIFLQQFIEAMEEEAELEEEFEPLVTQLKSFLNEASPKFYAVESSS